MHKFEIYLIAGRFPYAFGKQLAGAGSRAVFSIYRIIPQPVKHTGSR